MAIYRCSRCDNLVDDDWNPGEQDPENPYELICPSCLEGEDEFPCRFKGEGDE